MDWNLDADAPAREGYRTKVEAAMWLRYKKRKAVHDVTMRRGSRGIASAIPNLGPSRKWLVNIPPRLLYPLFENRVLRGIFGPKRDEVTEVEKLRNEELNDLYSLPNIVL